MKTTILEVAQKLALITNRPIGDFLITEVFNVVESSEEKQEPEERVEASEQINEEEISSDIYPIDGSGAKEDDVAVTPREVTEDEKKYAEQYDGELSDNGKVILAKKTMTKREYNATIKGMTEDELLDHPLLYVLFRSEDQATGNFMEWTDKFKKVKK